MPIHFKEFEKLLDKWLSFLMIRNPVNDGASWVSYKVMQKVTKAQFMKDMSKLFNEITKKDVEIIEKDGKKHFLINQSKL